MSKRLNSEYLQLHISLALECQSDAILCKHLKFSVVELTDSEQEASLQKQKSDDRPSSSPARMTSNRKSLYADEDMGWIVDDDEDDLQIEIVYSSPTLDRNVGDESLNQC